MLLHRLALVLALIGIVNVAQADQWLFHNVLIKDVSFFHRTISGTNYVAIQLVLDGTFSTGCAPTDSHGVVGRNTTTDFGNNWQMRYATFLAAHAQQLPVDIQVSGCNLNTNWNDYGEPYGLGWHIEGIRLHRE